MCIYIRMHICNMRKEKYKKDRRICKEPLRAACVPGMPARSACVPTNSTNGSARIRNACVCVCGGVVCCVFLACACVCVCLSVCRCETALYGRACVRAGCVCVFVCVCTCACWARDSRVRRSRRMFPRFCSYCHSKAASFPK